MSEEIIDDVVADEIPGNEIDGQDQEVIDQKPEVDKSLPRGYMSKEAWIEAGRDPEDWVSPEVFKERGERIKMKAEFENRLKNVNLFHERQIAILKADLEAKRDLAIETADKAEVKRLDKEIRELDALEDLNKPDQQEMPKPQEVVDWEEENPWINEQSQKSEYAKSFFAKLVREGKTMGTALRHLDKEMDRVFGDTKKKPTQIAESSRPGTGKDDGAKVTFASLTPDEKKIWNEYSDMWGGNQTEFLKTVADTRKAGKK